MDIRQHKERNLQREMDKIKDANEKLLSRQKQIMSDRDTLTKRIDSLRDELSKQEVIFVLTLHSTTTRHCLLCVQPELRILRVGLPILIPCFSQQTHSGVKSYY